VTDAVPLPEIDPADADRRVILGAVLLDVRERDEWQAGHDPRARHIPLNEIPLRVAEIPSDSEVIAICRSGGRSRQAAEWLVTQGFTVVNLSGGMRAWQAAGLPVMSEGGGDGAVI
jgi:rhodanese-related sulfurtransferase